jgi:hypothetical protein
MFFSHIASDLQAIGRRIARASAPRRPGPCCLRVLQRRAATSRNSDQRARGRWLDMTQPEQPTGTAVLGASIGSTVSQPSRA